MPKSVKVHDDTHRALKKLKARRRSKSIDEVIRDMIAGYTGARVDELAEDPSAHRLTSYLEEAGKTEI